MGRAWISFRRLHEALGCFPGEIEEFRQSYQLRQNIMAEIYIESSRPFDVHLQPQRFMAPLAPADPDKVLYSVTTPPLNLGAPIPEDAPSDNEAPKPKPLLCDIICSMEITVPDALAEALRRNEPQALQELFNKATEREEELRVFADLVTGTVGLRLHRQLVLSLVNEGPLARVKDRFSTELSGQMQELLDPVILSDLNFAQLQTDLQKTSPAQNDKWRDHAFILRWLARAWGQDSPPEKFIAFFVPVEMILNMHKMQRDPEAAKPGKAIRTLISQHGKDSTGELMRFYDGLLLRYSERPTLEERFRHYAENARLPGWESDVEAFSHYNKTRNGIVHRGQTDIRLHLENVKAELPHLKDLAERYISHAIFGDANVYVDRLRRLNAKEH